MRGWGRYQQGPKLQFTMLRTSHFSRLKAVVHDHLGPMLAFVGGLGLRKADALRQNISRSIGQVDSRNSLLVKKLMGPVVWTNAAGFLRVTGGSEGGSINEDSLEFPLDNTRIHPECYITHDFAPKICEQY